MSRKRIQGKSISYYAYAKNPTHGKIEQLFVQRSGGKRSQKFTGKIYKSLSEANQDMVKLNVRKGK